MEKDGEFARFVTEFGSKEQSKDDAEAAAELDPTQTDTRKKATAGATMMQAEERNVGSISMDVYKSYLSAGNGKVIVPLLILSLVLLQGANTMSSYWLVYWQERKWPRSQGFYVIFRHFSPFFPHIFSDGNLCHVRCLASLYVLLHGKHVRIAHVFCFPKSAQGTH